MNKDEIKNGVKTELIKLLAQELKQENSFQKMKEELMSELFNIKEEEKGRHLNSNDGYDPINDEEKKFKKEWGFLFNADVIKERFSKLKMAPAEVPQKKSFVVDFSNKLSSIRNGELRNTLDKFLQAKTPDVVTGMNGFQIPQPRKPSSSIPIGNPYEDLGIPSSFFGEELHAPHSKGSLKGDSIELKDLLAKSLNSLSAKEALQELHGLDIREELKHVPVESKEIVLPPSASTHSHVFELKQEPVKEKKKRLPAKKKHTQRNMKKKKVKGKK